MPFVPLGDTAMRECVALARRVASEAASRFGLPVFLYEEAAASPARRRLEDIRRGEFEGLAAKLADPAWTLRAAAEQHWQGQWWPPQYDSAKGQLERNLERAAQMTGPV